MPTLTLRLAVSSDQLERWYRGEVDSLQARDNAGRWVRLPVAHLRPYVGHDGLHGTFELTIDDNHRLLSIRQL